MAEARKKAFGKELFKAMKERFGGSQIRQTKLIEFGIGKERGEIENEDTNEKC